MHSLFSRQNEYYRKYKKISLEKLENLEKKENTFLIKIR